MAHDSRLTRLLEQYGIDPKEAGAAVDRIAEALPRPPAAEIIEEPEKVAPNWIEYREAAEAGHHDVGAPLDKPRTPPLNACKECGSAKSKGRCLSGCNGLTARVIPQAVGRGRRSR